jgi:glutathione synthase/RimK-type ligase-like ATP-grasp enzyme
MKIALVTCSRFPNLSDDDRPLIEMFAAHGITAVPVIWNDPDADWQSFSCLIIRSPWDYHLDNAAFNKWLDYLESNSIYALNPVRVLRQNQNKFYLRDLQLKGAEIVPTTFIDVTSHLDLWFVKENSWNYVVIKPSVSCGAYLTKLFSAADVPAILEEYKPIAQNMQLLVQPYIPQIADGEISMMFFNGEYSHAVIKKPKENDFRVQMEHGGSTMRCEPAADVIISAGKILSFIQAQLLYARVDGLILNGRFVLMELELLEPFLFFDYTQSARQRFVEQAQKMLANRQP